MQGDTGEKRRSENVIMLFLVVCNNQHLVRTPMRVLILNEKIKQKKSTFSLKLPLFWINQHIQLSWKQASFHFSFFFPLCPLMSSVVFTHAIKTFLFTTPYQRKNLLRPEYFMLVKVQVLKLNWKKHKTFLRWIC